MKKFLIPIICASLMLTGFTFDPDKVVYSGSCNNGYYLSNEKPLYAIDEDGVLTIYGDGVMEGTNYKFYDDYNYDDPDDPWAWRYSHP